MILLSRSEEIVLLGIWKLKHNAYGVTIREQVSKDTGHEWSFGAIARHEEVLAGRLLDFLGSRPRVAVVGSTDPARERRVPIISFVVDGSSSADIVRAVDPHGIGIRYGHFYSRRLVEALGLPIDDGVVRVSMAHYNTLSEVDRLLTVLDPIL